MSVRNAITETYGCRLPVFAFAHSAEVVAAVTRAGGIGVLGALDMTAEALDAALTYIDEHVDGLPYGVDIVVPAGTVDAGADLTFAAALAAIPERHKRFAEDLLRAHGVPAVGDDYEYPIVKAVGLDVSEDSHAHVEVALSHPVRLIVNALGPPPSDVVELAHDRGVKVGALIGSGRHVEAQLRRNVDLLVAQGTEAGGHTGEVATMVLVPEVVRAVAGRVPVLAAGGIGSGRQMLAALALGAAGVWTGTMWLTSKEAESHIDPVTRQNLLAARSTDTVRSKSMSGKPMRQLRNAWTDAWDGPDSPGCLPAPLQGIVHHAAIPRFRAARTADLCGYPAGQVIGQFGQPRTVAELMAALEGEFDDAGRQIVRTLSPSAR
jgi:NAD(P)H-dependent flavin oxidoreductase YrpB (nitropropane dioxygenase family)